MGAWEDGFTAGWRAANREYHLDDELGYAGEPVVMAKRPIKKKKSPRKASAANKRYGAAFKRLAPKYKKKSGGWKKDGFKRCAAAARKAAKK